jgi:hypothetical protein
VIDEYRMTCNRRRYQTNNHNYIRNNTTD